MNADALVHEFAEVLTHDVLDGSKRKLLVEKLFALAFPVKANGLDDKQRKLLFSIREALAIMIAAIEDYLDIPYDQSYLAKRQEKLRSMSPIKPVGRR
jgi:hypothetical protein